MSKLIIAPLSFPTPTTWSTSDKTANVSITNSGFTATCSAAGLDGVRAVKGVSTGKFYFEVNLTGSTSLNVLIGIAKSAAVLTSGGPGVDVNGWGYYSSDGRGYTNGSPNGVAVTYTASDVIGIGFDATNGKLFFSKNNTWINSGDPVAGTNAAFTGLTSGPYYPSVGDGTSGVVTNICATNFGHAPFAGTLPAGYTPWYA